MSGLVAIRFADRRIDPPHLPNIHDFHDVVALPLLAPAALTIASDSTSGGRVAEPLFRTNQVLGRRKAA